MLEKTRRAAIAWLMPASARRGWRTSAIVASLCVLVAAWCSRPLLRMLDTARIGSTSGIQFEAATNWILCGRYDQITSGSDPNNRRLVNLAEIRDPAAYDRSVIDLLEWAVGSRYAYCHQEPTAWGVAEMGMMLIDAAALQVNAKVRLRTLALEFAVARLVLIWMFAWALLRVGYSLIFVALTTGVAVYVTMLLGGHALYSAYPFILPVTLAGIGASTLVIDSRRAWSFLAGLLALGIWAAFLGALRTSHYPLALCILGGAIALGRPAAMRRRLVFAMFAGVVGIFLFDRAFIAPVRAGGADSNHAVAHSLVIGLSVPPNALATREGIQWDDAVGIAIAQRRDPKVVPLSAAYEKVLWGYYWDLWRQHRGEMLAIYRQKLHTTRDSLFSWMADTRPNIFYTEKDDRLLAWTATLARWISGVTTLGGLMLLLAASGIVLCVYGDAAIHWPVVAVGIGGFLGFLEAAIVLGSVAPWYSGVIIFGTAFAGIWPVEVALRSARVLIARPRAAAGVGTESGLIA